jgi:hypothetical protein
LTSGPDPVSRTTRLVELSAQSVRLRTGCRAGGLGSHVGFVTEVSHHGEENRSNDRGPHAEP